MLHLAQAAVAALAILPSLYSASPLDTTPSSSSASLSARHADTCSSKKKPNIVFIISDDQDQRQNSIGVMKHVQELLVRKGTMFEKFYSPISLCCPSRSAFLRAQCAHNTNITNVRPPYGGWPLFNEFGYGDEWLPTFLEEAGYDVRYTGKLMNGQTVDNIAALPPKGLVDHAFLLDPYTYDYWHPAFSSPNGTVIYRPGEYSTDVVAEIGLKYLDDAAKNPDKPFFVGIAPMGPHAHMPYNTENVFDAPIPAPRHVGAFSNVTLNTSRESFNPDVPSGASWVRELPKNNETVIEYITEYYRGRLESLLAVDELVEKVVKKLDEMGVLDETYIIYTTDNGYESNAGHRRQPGKSLAYEEDINIPLVVRGPDVPQGLIDTDSVYSLVDLASTILDIASAPTPYDTDGSLVPLTTSLRDRAKWEGGTKQFHLTEYWVNAYVEGKYNQPNPFPVNSTLKSLRVVERELGLDYAYTVWCTGEREIYDMTTDPDQMHNLASTLSSSSTKSSYITRLHTRLDALLLVLKTCSGQSCRLPWKSMFTNGKVKNLKDAMKKEYDDYFKGLPSVRYSRCELGYHRTLEAPFWSHTLAYSPEKSYAQC
ncbi:alkaline-phosphatase-like protein [Leucosporidium creatinivorum]|uniref:Alkaline-phosphatase-like protein n=1 Tax=Leucosporidium creatinivorum TaxID=106004 RepID=A0A1Y2EWP8_9BASI|nr:alkaline-phosphatase-like protein [Leucosporidium creatinivorum]